MLIPLDSLQRCLRDAGVDPRASTLVHVGAHLAEEHQTWCALGFRRIVYVEAVPQLVRDLERRFRGNPRVTVIEATVAATAGEPRSFHVNDPTYTSSLHELEPITLASYPEISIGASIAVTTTTLAELLDAHGLRADVLVLDVQGAEAEVLTGWGTGLGTVGLLLVEYQRVPLYAGSPSMEEIHRIAERAGLRLSDRRDDGSGLWGDAAYVRPALADTATRRRPWGGRRRRGRVDLMRAPYRSAYSQFGEDGLLRDVVQGLGITCGALIDVGAWDGMHLSNSRVFMERGWQGFLVEGDPDRADRLRASAPDPSRACVIPRMVGPAGTSISTVLDEAGCPTDVDLLSIDIDSDDLAVLEDFASSRTAAVVCIEYNPTIPPDLDVRNPPGGTTGNSFSLIARVADGLGYDLVGWTTVNQVFVRRATSHPFVVQAVPACAHPIGHSRLFWGYDGSLHDAEVSRDGTPYDGVPSDEVRPLWGQGAFAQPVPAPLRRYPPAAGGEG